MRLCNITPPLPSTCFYALCLISKTPIGADILLDEGWTTVRHSLEEKWPLVFDYNPDMTDEGTFLSPTLSPTKSFPPLFGSFDFQTLPSLKSIPKASSLMRLAYSKSTDESHPQKRLEKRVSDSETKKTPDVASPTRDLARSISRRNRKFFISTKEPRRTPSLMRKWGDQQGVQVRGKPPHPRPLSAADLLSDSKPPQT